MNRCYIRPYQQVHVIRHHDERMQLVTVKPSFTVADGIDRDLCDFILPQEDRTIHGSI